LPGRTIAREFGPSGIRANVACLSMVETGMLDGLAREKFDEIVSGIPLQRPGKPSDVAGAAAAAISAPALAQSAPEIKWRMSASWPTTREFAYDLRRIWRRSWSMTRR
jgi:NAD(P)-dependent dehydrogenase (short-subunit alcohol dehydrogenase family)